jgi:mRNA interferase YafQ
VRKRVVQDTKRFRRDYAKAKRSGRKIQKLNDVMEMLIDGRTLLPKHKDHALQGEWRYVRDCHVEGDWILLYELGVDEEGHEAIIFHATGTHENLFG